MKAGTDEFFACMVVLTCHASLCITLAPLQVLSRFSYMSCVGSLTLGFGAASLVLTTRTPKNNVAFPNHVRAKRAINRPIKRVSLLLVFSKAVPPLLCYMLP